MLPMIVSTFVLWYAIGYRFSILNQAVTKKSVRALVDDYSNGGLSYPMGIVENAVNIAMVFKHSGIMPLRRYLDDAFYPLLREGKKYSLLITIIVAISPLMGLLGTVIGMRETFESLQDMKLFTQSGGIAGGISQALITTQFGLAIAIPGLLINGYLNKRYQHVKIELDQIKDVVSTGPMQASKGC